MTQKYDFSKLMAKTRAVEVTLDRPRLMSYPLPVMQQFEEHFGMSAAAWLKQYVEDDPPIKDVYYIAWLGLQEDDPKLTLEAFEQMVPAPVAVALSRGPVLLALVGYGDLEN